MTAAVILHPPLADYSSPPEHVAALKAACAAAGHEVRAIDLNLRAFLDWTSAERLREAIGQAEARASALTKRLFLSFWEQQELLVLTSSLCEGLRAQELVAESLEVLKDPERVQRRDAQVLAAKAVDAVFHLASTLAFPFEISASGIHAPFLLTSRAAAARFEAVDPFRPLYDKLAAELAHQRPALAVVAISHLSQLLPSLSLAATLRAAHPSLTLVAAGPATAALMLGGDTAAELLLSRFDAAISGDDEQALPELCATAGKPKALAGVSWRGDLAVTGRAKQHAPLDPAGLPLPDYGDFSFADYPSPAATFAYRPSRGRHVGRADLDWTGFAGKGASRREMPPEKAAEQIDALTRQHGVRYVRLSGDLVEPAWLERFASALVERGAQLKWSCELEVRHALDAEQVGRWKAAGLVTVVVGLNENRDRSQADVHAQLLHVGRSLEVLARGGVATQVSALLAFPGESDEHARDTVSFLRSRHQEIDVFAVGDADPETRLAIFAEAFTDTGVAPVGGDELGVYQEFSRVARAKHGGDVERLNGHSEPRAYPLAGSVGTAPTLIAFERLGRRAFAQGGRPLGQGPVRSLSEGDRIRLAPSARMLWIPYQLSVLEEIENEELALREHELNRRARDLGADRVWSYSQRDDLRLRAGQRTPHVLAPGMAPTEITMVLAELLAQVGDQFAPVSQLVAKTPREMRDSLKRQLAGLHEKGALMTEQQSRRESHDQHRGGGPRPQHLGHTGGGGPQQPGAGGRRKRRRRRGRGSEHHPRPSPNPQNPS